MQRLNAVLPLKIDTGYSVDDHLRVGLLFRSILKFAPNLFSEILIVCPDGDIERTTDFLKNWLGRLPLRFIGEEQFIPALKNHRDKWGYLKQMVIKLWAAVSCPDPYIMTLDADIVCIKPTEYSNLFFDGKAIMQLGPNDQVPIFFDWYVESRRILNVAIKKGELAASVTPAILSRDIAQSLATEIERATKINMIDYLMSHKGRIVWSKLVRSTWTEYALYYAHAKPSDLLETYHLLTKEPKLLSANSLWYSRDLAHWNFGTCFAPTESAHFCAIQSNARIDLGRIESMVAPFLR